jgi:REP element-mobilizing transposase RayT
MPLGYHLILGAYGFWLPNDPRGSWSTFVGSYELFRHGPATKTTATHSVADLPHDHVARATAKKDLQRPAVKFTGIQARAVGVGFGDYVRTSQLPVWACAILPDHVHLVVGETATPIGMQVIQLKGHATRRLKEENLHPFAHLAGSQGRPPKCFARGYWMVMLDEVEDVLRAIEYVENNPVKAGLPKQRWSLVTELR